MVAKSRCWILPAKKMPRLSRFAKTCPNVEKRAAEHGLQQQLIYAHKGAKVSLDIEHQHCLIWKDLMWLWLSNSYEHVVQKHVGAVPFSAQRGRYHRFITGTIST